MKKKLETLLLESQGAIGSLSLNRPAKLNALNMALMKEMVEAANWFDAQTDVRVVIVRGNGRAFSGGADLKDAMSAPEASADWVQRREKGQLGFRMIEAIERMRAITIAEVHGYAIGGALLLMLACDLRMVAEGTVFSIPELDLGIPLAWGGIPRLVREIGPAMTKELVMTCRPFGPKEAKELGLLNRVVAADKLAGECAALAEELAAKPSVPLLITKEHVNAVAGGMGAASASFADGDLLLSVLSDPDSIKAAQAYYNERMGK